MISPNAVVIQNLWQPVYGNQYSSVALSCVVSSGHFCRLNTALHPVNRIQECSYFLFQGNKEKIDRDQVISIDKHFWAISTWSPRELYVSFITYSYPLSLQHPFDIIYLSSSCEASSDSFFLASNDTFTQEVDSRNLSIWKKIWKKLSDFILILTFNLTTLSNDELDKLVAKILELKRVSYQHVKKVLKQIDNNYTLVMQNWLLIIISVMGISSLSWGEAWALGPWWGYKTLRLWLGC